MIVDVDQPKVGPVTMAGSPFHMTETPGDVYAPAPALGQHSVEVLESMLGYSREKIDALIESGAVIQAQ